jgi:hypothetical protein
VPDTLFDMYIVVALPQLVELEAGTGKIAAIEVDIENFVAEDEWEQGSKKKMQLSLRAETVHW